MTGWLGTGNSTHVIRDRAVTHYSTISTKNSSYDLRAAGSALPIQQLSRATRTAQVQLIVAKNALAFYRDNIKPQEYPHPVKHLRC